MIDSVVFQNNQMNWYIGIVYCGKFMDFEIVYCFSNVDFLVFFVSKNGIINIRVVIQLNYFVVVVCIGCFKEQIIVRG